MKKMLMVLLLVVFAASLFAGVDVRLRQISYTPGAAVGNTETLVVAIDCRGSHAYQIYSFSASFNVGDTLIAHLTSSGAPVDQGFFPDVGAADYSQTLSNVNGVASVEYISDVAGGGGETVLTANVWNEVVRFTYQWPRTQTSQTTTDFEWNDFNAEVYLASIFAPISVRGIAINMSDQGFEDFSLPVTLASFNANFDYELGGTEVEWVTASEQGVQAFRVYRSEDLKNWVFVAEETGAGYSTEGDRYSILDTDIEAGKEYQYALVEVNNDGYKGLGISVAGSISPEKFELGNNYPNPFNPSTYIPFEIVEGGHATLKIYNLLGQEVRTLLNKELPLGYIGSSKEDAIFWDGLDNSGNALPSGVYLYKLQCGNNVQVKRMSLVK